MKTVSVHQAKAHFSRLVEEAATGNEIVIAKFGKPVAKLVPIRTAPRPSCWDSASPLINLRA
jgi:prevent-host-death family protein